MKEKGAKKIKRTPKPTLEVSYLQYFVPNQNLSTEGAKDLEFSLEQPSFLRDIPTRTTYSVCEIPIVQ